LGDIVIRGYRSEDKEACRGLWAELTQWHRNIYGDQGIGGPDPGMHFDEHLEKAGAEHLLVATDGDRVVGLVGFLVTEEEVEVEPLIVAESHRGGGIGSMLVEAVVDRVGKMGIKFLSVRPVARNKKALEFFRSKGFDKIGRIELFIDYTGREWKDDLRFFDLDFGY
jgi:GNAT superfamily N-acetyltransferase